MDETVRLDNGHELAIVVSALGSAMDFFGTRVVMTTLDVATLITGSASRRYEWLSLRGIGFAEDGRVDEGHLRQFFGIDAEAQNFPESLLLVCKMFHGLPRALVLLRDAGKERWANELPATLYAIAKGSALKELPDAETALRFLRATFHGTTMLSTLPVGKYTVSKWASLGVLSNSLRPDQEQIPLLDFATISELADATDLPWLRGFVERMLLLLNQPLRPHSFEEIHVLWQLITRGLYTEPVTLWEFYTRGDLTVVCDDDVQDQLQNLQISTEPSSYLCLSHSLNRQTGHPPTAVFGFVSKTDLWGFDGAVVSGVPDGCFVPDESALSGCDGEQLSQFKQLCEPIEVKTSEAFATTTFTHSEGVRKRDLFKKMQGSPQFKFWSKSGVMAFAPLGFALFRGFTNPEAPPVVPGAFIIPAPLLKALYGPSLMWCVPEVHSATELEASDSAAGRWWKLFEQQNGFDEIWKLFLAQMEFNDLIGKDNAGFYKMAEEFIGKVFLDVVACCLLLLLLLLLTIVIVTIIISEMMMMMMMMMMMRMMV